MSANAFRSPLMQQLVAAARSQHRPPLVLSEFSTRNTKNNNTAPSCTSSSQQVSAAQSPPRSISHQLNIKVASNFTKNIDTGMDQSFSSIRTFSASAVTSTVPDDYDFSSFQNIMKTRRTTSNYKPIEMGLDFSDITVSRLLHSMQRAILCGTTAPNHYRTEPTTYYRIVANTDTCNHLLDICYNVALCKNLKKKSKAEAHINAESKRKKWRETVGGYIVVCVGNQPPQDDEYPYKSIDFAACSLTNNFYSNRGTDVSDLVANEGDRHDDHDESEDFYYWYDNIPLRPPQTEKQLEDYASACASIQNILLSLHSEEWGSKWASGPIIRCRALRHLVGCKEDDAIAGLIMIGKPKLIGTPKPWRRRRDLSDVMKDL